MFCISVPNTLRPLWDNCPFLKCLGFLVSLCCLLLCVLDIRVLSCKPLLNVSDFFVRICLCHLAHWLKLFQPPKKRGVHPLSLS